MCVPFLFTGKLASKGSSAEQREAARSLKRLAHWSAFFCWEYREIISWFSVRQVEEEIASISAIDDDASTKVKNLSELVEHLTRLAKTLQAQRLDSERQLQALSKPVAYRYD